MKRKKFVRRYNFVELDKAVTLKDQVQSLMPVNELQFCNFLEKNGDLLEVRSIGYIDRYYNDYGDLIALQEGIEGFYLKGGVDAI